MKVQMYKNRLWIYIFRFKEDGISYYRDLFTKMPMAIVPYKAGILNEKFMSE